MAQLLKSEARDLIRAIIDDPNQKMWTDARLDILTQTVLDSRWAKILERSPWETSQLDTLTPTSPGFIDLSTAPTKRFHRIQSVVRDGQAYRKADHRNVVIQNNQVVVAKDFTYLFLGSQLWLFPLSVSPNVELRYAYKPTKYTSYANGTAVEFPDGAEDAYVFEVSWRAMMKGNRQAAEQFKVAANEALDDLFTQMKSKTIGPNTPFNMMSSIEAGGV